MRERIVLRELCGGPAVSGLSKPDRPQREGRANGRVVATAAWGSPGRYVRDPLPCPTGFTLRASIDPSNGARRGGRLVRGCGRFFCLIACLIPPAKHGRFLGRAHGVSENITPHVWTWYHLAAEPVGKDAGEFRTKKEDLRRVVDPDQQRDHAPCRPINRRSR